MLEHSEDLSPQFSRVEIQRMRVNIVQYIDKHSDVIQINPEDPTQVQIDLQRFYQAGLGESVENIYNGNEQAIYDDYRFFRFVRAARQYREAADEITRDQIVETELFPYMEYSLNTSYTEQEKVMLSAVGTQPLSDKVKAELKGEFYWRFIEWKYPPTYSQEYRTMFMGVREMILHPTEYVPRGENSTLLDLLIEETARSMVSFMTPPQDYIREELINPQAVELTPIQDTEFKVEGLEESINKILQGMDELHRNACVLLWGLTDGLPRTTAETAKVLNISIDEVKRLEQEIFHYFKKFPNA